LVTIQARRLGTKVGEVDVAMWKSKSGVYSYGETLHFLLELSSLVVPWWKVVWHSLAIPCHAFILRLVFRQALATKERMCGAARALWDILYVASVFMSRNRSTIFFSIVVSAVEYGET
jgi:hypothetical protein